MRVKAEKFTLPFLLIEFFMLICLTHKCLSNRRS